MSKRDKIIWAVITVLVICVFISSYKSGREDSMILVGNNDNYYFALYSNNNFSEKKLSDFELVRYDKETKKKERYNLHNIGNEKFADMREIKSLGDWILLKNIYNRNIVGININTGTAEVLVDKTPKNEETYAIKDLELNGNKLIYAYVSDFKTTLVIKDIVTQEECEIGTFDTIENVPVSIYEDKAAYILDNRINVYSINDKQLIKTFENLYSGELLVYKDNIYTYRKNGDYQDLVKVDMDENDQVILEKVLGEYNLYCDNDRVVYDNYFYDTNDNKLYLRTLENSWTQNRILLDDYIYSKDSKYEKLNYDENYYEYPLKTEFIRSNKQNINDEEDIAVLVGGEVAITKKGTNYVLRSFKGFDVDQRFLLWDLTYENNKVYNIAENNKGELELLSIDINTGDKQLIKKVNENISTIKHLTIHNGELGYLVQDGSESILITYNINTQEENSLKLDLSGYIQQLLFNDKYIVLLPWDERNLYVLGKGTGNILSKSQDKYYSLFALNDNEIFASSDLKYEVLDYNLNKLKEYNNYDKALEFFEK
ncbi:Uncharacterised protein [uncultured Clostridium sp.]|uniref:hypothetical protein n=1 Tax=uncultured Clostridium sp. TaxID=59620 RepID=UPI0008218DC6|nr:hypothetical protein [uncultured Clostridium sp.]SCK03202.1 Uncharacterised protein [uncultured Clostridium sp.]